MFAATLLSDASWCPETGIAGFGYWIATSRGKLGGGGSFETSGSNLAEMKAVCNTLMIARQAELVLNKDAILIQTDSIAAIGGLEATRKLNPDEEKVQGIFLALTRGIYYNFRHVKAHTGRYESRYYANRKCDNRARREMENARYKFRSVIK